MAGSLSYQVYQSDGGGTYAILCDKSNALAVNASASATPGSLPAVTVPRNIKPRYALYADSTGFIRRKVTLLRPSDVIALSGTSSFTPQGETTVVRLTAVRGEKFNLPKLVDTAQTT